MLPSQDDYVETYFTLFGIFQQGRGRREKRGRPYTYADKVLIVFFTMMLMKRITAFKAQHRWLIITQEKRCDWVLKLFRIEPHCHGASSK